MRVQMPRTLFRGRDLVASLSLLTMAVAVSAQTTSFVADLLPGTTGSYPAYVADLNGTAYFLTTGSGNYGLWRSDGTSAGTSQVLALPSAQGVQNLTALRDKLIFIYIRLGGARELWASDGTAAGTGSIATGALGIWPAGEIAYLNMNGGTSVTDGTAAGTVQVIPAVGGWMRQFDGRTWFVVGTTIWTSDGTAAGTSVWEQGVATASLRAYPGEDELWFVETTTTEHRFSTIDSRANPRRQRFALPRSSWGSISDVFGFAGFVWFTLGSGGTGLARLDLYRWSDANGVEAFAPNSPSEFLPRNFLVRGDRMYFAALGANNTGEEPWVSDGTFAGTQMLADIHPTGSSNPFFVPVPRSRGQVFLARPSGSVQNYRIWETDGTPAGTRQLSSAVVQLNDTWSPFAAAGGKSLFCGVDATNGQELWLFDPGAVAQPLGRGCGTTPTPPTLSATDPVLGGTSAFAGRVGPSTAVAALLIGLPQRPPMALAPGGGCSIFVDMGMPTIDLFAPVTAGRFTLNVGIPNAPELTDMALAAQAVAFPSPLPFGIDVTNALLLVPGS